MASKEDMEEGEISDISDGEVPLGHYTPLERPVTAKAVLPPCDKNGYDDYDSDDAPALPCESDSDSDSGCSKPKAKSKGGMWGRRDALALGDGGGDKFKEMARAFQEERNRQGLNKKRKNNIWGSLIQEENLNSEMSGALGVGRSLRDLNSDRGAETYDYTLIAKERREEEERRRNDHKGDNASSLDDEMDSYWNNKSEAPLLNNESDKEEMDVKDHETEVTDEGKRGTKRSVKERLGGKRVIMDRFKNEVLPAPGKPRQIPDIFEESLIEGSDDDFGRELAERLKEEKEDMIINLVKIVGRNVALDFFRETQKIEAKGGMVINNGARRRTAGGVMLHLLRKSEDPSIKDKVKKFFSESQKNDSRRKIAIANKRKKKNFEKEMEDFLLARRKMEEQRKLNDKDDTMDGENQDDMKEEKIFEDEEEGELAPLPNILSMIANSLDDKKPCNSIAKPTVTRVSSFKEPDAPPNSVERAEAERSLLDYDDEDFLLSTNESEDIELF